MSLPNIHNSEKDIHTSQDRTLFSNDFWANKINDLVATFPTGSNYNYYSKIIRELNIKYSNFDLSSKIAQPVDAGFRPLNLQNFFDSIGGGGGSSSEFPSILLENGSYLLMEDGFKIIL